MRILVVEDEHRIAQALKQGLEQESYAVDVCYDGEDGLNSAKAEDYDIILLDVMLPSMTGFEICTQLRAAGIHTPILLLTAKDQSQDIVTGLNAGADDYLAKPFSFEVLLARIKALLRRPQTTIGSILAADDLQLDTVSKKVTRDSTEIHLSTKEFALLEYLLRNKNKVLSKNNIMSHVWDFDADILPNTVEVFVAYLRAKIDKPFKGPDLVVTVRGFGYKIEAA
jgi:two-component system copper resistance phosphate regulon response regulator CusR